MQWEGSTSHVFKAKLTRGDYLLGLELKGKREAKSRLHILFDLIKERSYYFLTQSSLRNVQGWRKSDVGLAESKSQGGPDEILPDYKRYMNLNYNYLVFSLLACSAIPRLHGCHFNDSFKEKKNKNQWKENVKIYHSGCKKDHGGKGKHYEDLTCFSGTPK